MPRKLLLAPALCALLALGCRLPPDREPLTPLPEDGAAFKYGDLMTRARAQFSAALDAFYTDAWKDLEDAAIGLEQTARFLPKASMPPPHVKDGLFLKARQMRNDAVKLSEGARVKNVDRCNEALRDLNLHIRALRPPEPADTSKEEG